MLVRVGRYILVERLGSGGMGEVFRATDRSGIDVALKRLAVTDEKAKAAPKKRAAPAVELVTEEATHRSGVVVAGVVPASSIARPLEATLGIALAREFRALASLRHPNVVEVLDYGFDGSAPFFTMQLFAGAVPITHAAKGASFTTKVELLGQLLRAVRYIHGRGILHRDLKPSNVLVDQGTVKVVDFGLAVLGADRDAALARWGTRGYRAPELLEGAAATAASDLYAVGLIAREIFDEEPDGPARALVDSLTSLDPTRRPRDAGAAIAELAERTGIAFPLDTAETLDSTVTTANLVGRERELALFDAKLGALVRDGRGGAFRLEGESGIGKSRMLDELRTRALVAGCVVLEGQSLEAGGGSYEALGGVLHDLALTSDVATADVGEFDGDHIFDVLDRGLPSRATVVILDDLQWSTEAEAAVVARLARRAATSPILVVAAHRENVSAAVAKELAELPVVKLERLGADDARRLVRSVISGASDEIASALADESEGHPFFLVELLRGEAAVLSGADISLAQRIDELVRARLAGLSPSDRRFFEIAAVVGREVLPELVAAIAGGETQAIDAWLRIGLARGLIETKNDRYRFAHDKMREGVLATLAPDERKALHLRAGREIERRAKDPVSYAAALAHHYTRGGDDAKTAAWAGIAGERAFAAASNAEAVRLFSDALAAMGDGADPVRRARLTRLMGIAHEHIGDYSAANACAAEAIHQIRRAPRPRSTAAREEAMLDYYYFGEAAFYRDAPLDMIRGMFGALLQARGTPPASQVPVYAGTGLLAGTILLKRLADHWGQKAIAIAEEVGTPSLLAQAMQRAAVPYVVRAEWSEARERLLRAQETAVRAKTRRQWQETTTVLGLTSSLRGHWEDALPSLLEVHESAKENGDRQAALWGGPIAAICHVRLGNLARAEVLLEESHARLDEASTMYDRTNLYAAQSLHRFASGDHTRAIADASDVVDRLANMKMSAYWTFHALETALETLFTAAENPNRDLRRAIAQGCGEGRRLARFCVFARPSALLWDGRRLALSGDVRRARALWRKAETLAREKDVTWVAAAARRLLHE